MPSVDLTITGNAAEKTEDVASRWSKLGNIVTGVNQAFELISRTAGTVFNALDRTFETAAKAEALDRAITSLAGGVEQGRSAVNAFQEGTQGLITRLEAAESATKVLSQGVVEGDEEMRRYAEGALVLGRAMGIDAAQSVDRLTIAIARGSNQRLDDFGIMVDLEKAYNDYAASLDRTADSLSNAEKNEAFRLEALRLMAEKTEELGGLTLSEADNWQRLLNEIADSEEVMQRAVAEGIGPLMAALTATEDGQLDLSTATAGLIDLIKNWGDESDDATQSVKDHEVEVRGLRDEFMSIVEATKLTIQLSEERGKGLAAEERQQRNLNEALKRAEETLGIQANDLPDLIRKRAEFNEKIEREAELMGMSVEEWRAIRVESIKNGRVREDLNRVLDETTDIFEENAEQMKLIGLTADDTEDGLRSTADAAFEAFKIARDSGQFSADVLRSRWTEDVVPKILSAYGEIPERFQGINRELTQQGAADFSMSVDEWITAEKGKLEARKDAWADPTADAIKDGVERGFSDAEIGDKSEDVGERIGEAMVAAVGDLLPSEMSKILDEAFGETLSADEGGGRFDEGNELDDATEEKVRDIFEDLERAGGDTRGLEFALNAFEAGNLDAIERQIRLYEQDIENIRKNFRQTPATREQIARREAELAALKELGRMLFNLAGERPSFRRGGVGDFGEGTLAELHGREAIIPLEEGGDRIAKAILGEDAREAMVGQREEQRMTNRLLARIAGDLGRERSRDSRGGMDADEIALRNPSAIVRMDPEVARFFGRAS